MRCVKALEKLSLKHPALPLEVIVIPPVGNITTFQVTEQEVLSRIRSFPRVNPGIRRSPTLQHLLDLINSSVTGPELVSTITAIVNISLAVRLF